VPLRRGEDDAVRGGGAASKKRGRNGSEGGSDGSEESSDDAGSDDDAHEAAVVAKPGTAAACKACSGERGQLVTATSRATRLCGKGWHQQLFTHVVLQSRE
jgi:hypothetical protein